MRRVVILVSILGLLSSCGGGGRTVPAGPTTSITLPGQLPDEVLAFTTVSFGEKGYVAITNFGERSVSLAGHFLYQRPAFLEMQAVRLEPGESMWVLIDLPPAPLPVPAPVAVLPSSGLIGSLDAAGGDLALFAAGVLNDPNAMLDYVRWGSPGEGSEAVAVAAGIWPEGAAVPTTPETASITAPNGADGPDGWTPG